MLQTCMSQQLTVQFKRLKTDFKKEHCSSKCFRCALEAVADFVTSAAFSRLLYGISPPLKHLQLTLDCDGFKSRGKFESRDMFRTMAINPQIAGLAKWRSVSQYVCQTVKVCDIRKSSSLCKHQPGQQYGCEKITTRNGLSSLVTARELSTSKWSGSRYYNPKISITMKRNIERGTSKLMAAEERAKAKRERRLAAKPSIKNPLIDDTRKTKTFNFKFQENVGNVMADFPELLGHGIAITRVSTRADFSEVLVFWVSSPSKVEKVAELLEAHVRRIRRAMIEVAGMGQIPRITFVKDIAYMLENELDGLFR